jgi:hypothetical protein
MRVCPCHTWGVFCVVVLFVRAQGTETMFSGRAAVGLVSCRGGLVVVTACAVVVVDQRPSQLIRKVHELHFLGRKLRIPRTPPLPLPG